MNEKAASRWNRLKMIKTDKLKKHKAARKKIQTTEHISPPSTEGLLDEETRDKQQSFQHFTSTLHPHWKGINVPQGKNYKMLNVFNFKFFE